MIVDTGGIWTTLDSNWANTNGVRAYSEGAYLSGFGEVGSHRVRAGSLDTLQIGSVTFKNVYVALTTLGAWKLGVEAQGTEDIHGILGAETLAEIGAIIDFNAGKMWFNPSNQAR
jgi:hypothetical protein